MKKLITKYVEILKTQGNLDEVYKWDAINHFQNHWNIEAEDFKKMFEMAFEQTGNLLYHNSRTYIFTLVEYFPEEVRRMFKNLYNEETPLPVRIASFQKDAEDLLPKAEKAVGADNLKTFQDERTLSVYLSFRFPEKYYLYKASFYKKLCEHLNVPVKKAGKRFLHYLQLAEEIKEKYIANNSELLRVSKEIYPKTSWNDSNLVTQNFLYQSLEKENTEVSKHTFKEDVNYWIFQGSPKIYDIENALKNNHLKSFKVSAHKAKIKPEDKIIFWQTGEKAGCYALAEVVSKVGKLAEDPEELQYYLSPSENDGEGNDRVRIEITKNLVNNPILWSKIKERPEFSNFKAGNQGTNFSATQDEYNALLNIASGQFNEVEGEKEFRQVIQAHGKEDIVNYFEFLDSIVYRFDIQPNEVRMVSNVRKNGLIITIGQRYSWNLNRPKGKTKFSLITKNETEKTTEAFEGAGEQPFYNQFNDYSFALENKENALSAIAKELERSKKSSFRKHNNQAFRKAIFDVEYRNYILESSEFNLNPSLEMKPTNQNFPLNQILYGPPGTGKTFRLQNEYFEKFTVRESSLTRKQYLENMIVDKTWWQVLSMTVFDLGSVTVNEIMEHELIKTKAELSNSKLPRTTIWGRLQAHTVEECKNVNVSDRSEPRMFFKDDETKWSIDKNLLEQYYPEAIINLEESKNFQPSSDKLIRNYEFVTFHQSFSYEDFVEGIKPKMEEQDTEVSYEIADGVFKKLALKAKADPDNDYAIFIDEINRGNVSAIFGELITLLEEDKRIGGDNPLSVKLPYSKKELEVPSNLYVFGTMNTADRSVEALDTALRRRFSFKEIMPDPSLLEDIEFNGFNLKEVLETINERIEFLLDRDHTIGHSYFMNLESGDTEALEEVFKNKVIPLLQEYFYHDYEKIALILGAGFVTVKTNHVIKFPSFDGINEPDNVTLCELVKDIDDIEEAVRLLLNRNAQ